MGFFAEYFTTVSSFETYNAKLDETETQDGEMDEEDDSESHSEDETSRPKRLAPVATSSTSCAAAIVTSPDYYKSMHTEITLLVLRHECERILARAKSSRASPLTDRERLLVAVVNDFAAKKSFLSSSSANAKSVDSSRRDLDTLLTSSPRCDVCNREFDFQTSLDHRRVECKSGHLMRRCERTLLPLDNFDYSKCSVCHAVWNKTRGEEFPNFDFLVNESEFCLFCN